MSNWKIYNLSEVVDRGRGISYGIVQPGTFVDDGVPIIKVNNLTDRRLSYSDVQKVKPEVETKYQRTKLRGNEVLISLVGSLGYIAKVSEEMIGWNVARAVGVLPIADTFDKEWIYWFLKSPQAQNFVHGQATTSVQATLNLKELQELQIAYPDEAYRKKATEILSALDDKIELNRRMNQTLEQMAQTLYEKYSDVDEFVPLTDLVELNPKLTLKKGKLSQYVEMSNLSETSASIKQSVLREYSGGAKFQNNDTLLARITPCLENGKTGFVDILDDGEVGFGSTEYIVMRAMQSVSPYFVYCVARDKAFREHAMRSMTGTSGRQRVQTDMLVKFALPIWSSESMESFHVSAHAAFQKIKANTAEINTLTTLRDTLLPKLMSGEIDVMQTQAADMHEPILS